MTIDTADCTCPGDHPRRVTETRCEHAIGCPVHTRWVARWRAAAGGPANPTAHPGPDPRQAHGTDERLRGPIRAREAKPL